MNPKCIAEADKICHDVRAERERKASALDELAKRLVTSAEEKISPQNESYKKMVMALKQVMLSFGVEAL